MSGELAPYPFLGKIVTVDGAASGIGRATDIFVYASVALADINREALQDVAKHLREIVPQLGQQILVTVVDVCDSWQVSSWIDEVVSTLGSPDCCANIVGATTAPGFLTTQSDDDFTFAVDVNLRSVFYCIRAQILRLAADGSIVNVSSGSALQGAVNIGLYSAAKGGVNTLTGAAAREQGRQGIRINAVSPGATPAPSLLNGGQQVVNSAIRPTPLGRAAQPVEIAKAHQRPVER